MCQNTATPSDDPPKIAGVGVRLLGVLYDGMLVLALLFLMGLVLVSLGTLLFGEVGTASVQAQELPAWYRRFVLSPSFILTLIGFYGLFWRKSGQTLGMQTWRLKTVAANGRLLTWGQSALRILCASIVPLLGALMASLLHKSVIEVGLYAFAGLLLNYAFGWVHPKGLAVHDLLSNTLTVRLSKLQRKGWF